MESPDFLDKLLTLFNIILVIIGSASAIVAALHKVADITPTDKDDIFLGKVSRFLAKVSAILDRIALNLPADRARPSKQKNE